MNAAQLKLNYPEILEEIIRKVDSAVLSSKSPSILERVKCCSQSFLVKGFGFEVVAAGSLMTFLLTCAGNNILNSITEKTASHVHNFASSTWVSPDSAKLSSLVKEVCRQKPKEPWLLFQL